MNRNRTSITFAMLIGIIFSLVCLTGAEAGETTPKLLTYTAHGSPKGVRAEAVQWWASEIEKRSNNQVKFKFFWSGSLLKPGDAMEGIGMGTANCGGGWGIYHPAKTPLWTVADPPFSHSDPYVGLRVMQEMYTSFDPMIKELERYNVKLLAPFVTGMTQLGTGKKSKPVLVPDDTKGMKIRYAGGMWSKFWQTCDAVPVNLTQGEVYEGLMRGTVDGTQSYFFILDAYKHWDVINYYSVIDAGELCSYGLIINLDDWKAMSPELQEIFQQVSDEFVVKYAKGLIENRERIKKIAEEKGVKFYYPTVGEKKLWQEKAAPFMEEWVSTFEEKGLPARQTQNEFLRLKDKYEKELAANGYPWKN